MLRKERLKPYLILLLALVQLGCGGSNEALVFTGSGANPIGTPISIAGRVLPGVSASGVPVRLLDANGTVFAQATTDESGDFLFFGIAGPQAFRAVAELPSGLVLENQVDDNGGGRFLFLNIPTTLAARIAEQEGVTPSQAKTLAAEFLGLADSASLEYGLSELDPAGFSHLRFFLEAEANGGVEAFLEQLLAQLDAGPFRFTPTAEDLQAPLTGIPPELLSGFAALQASPVLERAIIAERLRQAPYIAGLAIDGEDQRPPLTQRSLNGVSPRIVDTLLDQLRDVAWTHIADALNLNYGTTRMLEIVQDDLTEVLAVLADMTITIDKDELDDAVDSLYDNAIDDIQVFNTDLAQLDLEELLANPETPYEPSNDSQALLSNLAVFQVETNLADIAEELDPINTGTNILVDGQSYILEDLYGLDLTQDTGNFPYRTQDLLDQVCNIAQYYSQYQQLGINLLGETAHLQDNPTTMLRTAQEEAEETLASLYRQRGVIPPSTKLPANVVVDIQGALMWYVTLQSPRSCSEAISYADSFTLSNGNGGTYTDWRLPTAEECNLLRDRARLIDPSLRDSSVNHKGNDTSAGVHGYSAQGLTALGFTNASILNDDGSVLYLSYSLENNKSGSPSQFYSLNGTDRFSENPEFKFNDGSNSATLTTSTRPFFLCRSLGKPVCPIVNNGAVGVDETDAEIPFVWTSVQDFEFELFGRVNNTQSAVFLVPEGSTDGLPTRLGCNLNYQFYTGGSFTIGDLSGTSSRDYPRRVHDSTGLVTYKTYEGSPNAFTAVNSRNQLVSFSSTNTDCEVTPTGRLRWRADGNGGFGLTCVTSIYDMDGTTTDFSYNLNTAVSSPRQLVQVQMFPRNREYNLLSLPSTSEQYYCLAFYSDDTVEDVTSTATWTAVDDNTGQPVAGAFFSTQQNGLFAVDNTSPEFVRLTVSIGGASTQNDQTVIKSITQ